MNEETRKMELSEAYSLVRSMSNAFKAFKDAEEVILAAMQAREEMARATKSIELLRAEEAAAIATADAANVKRDEAIASRDTAEKELGMEKERILATKAEMLAAIQKDVDAARTEADTKIAGLKAEVDKSSSDALTYKAESAAIIAGVNEEIAKRQEILDGLNAEIDALKQKFA